MRDAVENLIIALVDEKRAVEVSDYEDGGTTVIEVRVAESDMGRLIGKQGRTIKAIRSLLFYAGQKHRRRYNLQVIED
ncbi:MAG: KH domain-containing protein [Pyrinomonadaceae bacterium]